MNIDADIYPRIKAAVSETFRQAVSAFVDRLQQHTSDESVGEQAAWLATQLRGAKASPDFVREIIRSQVLRPRNALTHRVRTLRSLCGWTEGTKTFDGLQPDFLDVVYLLPPHDHAIVHSLAPVLQFHRERQGSEHSEYRLLDIGAGTGLLIRILKHLEIDARFFAIDPAARLLEYAQKQCPAISPTFGRAESFEPKTHSCEVALCHMVLHHISETNDDRQYRRAFNNMFAALAEHGLLVYTDKFWSARRQRQASHGLTIRTPSLLLELSSGQELEIKPTDLNAIQSFQPHPQSIAESRRTWREAAERLSQAGFLIEEVKPLNQVMVQFVCRKPRISNWQRMASTPRPLYAPTLRASVSARRQHKGHTPYQWTWPCLQKLYQDITGHECPDTGVRTHGFLRGIAYFSWHQASRLFLVRRAVPFDFHILSYSHVHDGWGTLGRMVEEFEKGPKNYKGYSCLTQDAVQRTLPFQGDIGTLKYEAAMAVPIFRPETFELRGAFLFFLATRSDVPLHTGSEYQKKLVMAFHGLNRRMNWALDVQERALDVIDTPATTAKNWRRLVRGNPDLVIAELTMRFVREPDRKCRRPVDVCSKVQALLSGRDCFSILEDDRFDLGRATILVAARHGLSYEDIEDRVLGAVGVSAQRSGLLSYKCVQLGKDSAT